MQIFQTMYLRYSTSKVGEPASSPAWSPCTAWLSKDGVLKDVPIEQLGFSAS